MNKHQIGRLIKIPCPNKMYIISSNTSQYSNKITNKNISLMKKKKNIKFFNIFGLE